MIAVELVIKIFFGMAIGFLLYKMKLLNTSVNASLSRILVEIICPCMVLANIISLSGQNVIPKSEVYSVLLIGVVIYVILIPVSYLVVKLLRAPKKSQGVLQCFLLFGNVGFIGLPVAESLYGSVGVFYMALLNIHFNMLCYSYGLWLVIKDADVDYKFSIKKILNPAVIVILVSLVFFLLDIRFSSMIISPISFVGNLTSPLSMIILGSSIAAHNLKQIFIHWRLYVLTAVRMIAFPLITFLIMKTFFGPGMMTNIVTFYLGTPAAAITSMFAMAYGGDEETATLGTAMMNIFCIITIPLTYLMTTYL